MLCDKGNGIVSNLYQLIAKNMPFLLFRSELPALIRFVFGISFTFNITVYLIYGVRLWQGLPSVCYCSSSNVKN